MSLPPIKMSPSYPNRFCLTLKITKKQKNPIVFSILCRPQLIQGFSLPGSILQVPATLLAVYSSFNLHKHFCFKSQLVRVFLVQSCRLLLLAPIFSPCWNSLWLCLQHFTFVPQGFNLYGSQFPSEFFEIVSSEFFTSLALIYSSWVYPPPPALITITSSVSFSLLIKIKSRTADPPFPVLCVQWDS